MLSCPLVCVGLLNPRPYTEGSLHIRNAWQSDQSASTSARTDRIDAAASGTHKFHKSSCAGPS